MSGRSGADAPEMLAALRGLCAAGGALPLPRLRRLVPRMSEDGFCSMVLRGPCFLLVRGPRADGALRAEDCAVVARTSLRLCRRYGRGEPCAACGQLHLCKYFVYGTCRFGKGRRICKFSHDLQSDHNLPLLCGQSVQQLQDELLFLLLLQSDPALLPEVCVHYNKGSCSFSSSCTKVHLCLHFLQDRCIFGRKCNKLHELDEQGRRLLEERGLSRDTVRRLPDIYRNAQQLRAHAASAVEKCPDSWCESARTAAGGAICLHFLRNSCRFHDECLQVHFPLPYRWQVLDRESWTDMEDMEDIERDFCDPSKTQSGGERPVDFQTMTCGSLRVRRLSTVSSVLKPPHYSLTTRWRWFYKGDHKTWVEYGQQDETRRPTSVSSETLEKVFLSGESATVEVVKGQRTYVISFQDLYQRNFRHNTKRKVRRRPHFVSAAEVQQRLARERTHTCPSVRPPTRREDAAAFTSRLQEDTFPEST